MSELQPKKFQTEALKKLREYLELARLLSDPAKAFERVTGGSQYRPLPGMESVPSVCLRLPTGGGKTMLAAMSVAVAARSYLDRELPPVLWLVPSDAILQQTKRALTDTDHPYRRALGKEFGDRVRVFELSDFANLTPQDIRSYVCVVIGTMAMVQKDDTDKYRVYKHNENLEGHFTAAARATPGLELIEPGRPGAGTPKFSFANLMKVQRPLMILDEAHQFMTPLADRVRGRLGAGLIVELTATPKPESNELYFAHASELKDEDMIKLPVVLEEHTGVWQQAVHDAVQTRKRLADIATGEPEYVRPLLLIQAQNAGSEGDWKAVKQYLLDTEGLREQEIAVHTGDLRELDGVNLFSEECPVTTVITVKALKEGWDCSFAYVLCSTANVGAASDVEQLLGRVLRMPYAKARLAPELNKAYAHVESARFQDAAKGLKDSLVAMGFEEAEAKAAVQSSFSEEPLFDQPAAFELIVAEEPEIVSLPPAETRRVEVERTATGEFRVEVREAISPALREKLLERVPEPERPKVSARVEEHNRAWAPSPAQRGVRFSVPRLTVEDESEQRVLFTREVVEEVADFNLTRYPANLSGFGYDAATRRYLLDVDGEQVTLRLMGEPEPTLPFGASSITVTQLVAWLDSKLRHPRVNKSSLSAWILQAIEQLLKKPNITLDVLDRGRFILFRKLEQAREKAWQAELDRGYQELLFDPGSTALASEEFAFRFPLEYPANWYCDGTDFRKHYYKRVGEMKGSGEEYTCAVEMDQHPRVRHWVRNLAGRGRENTSFWLQTKTDKFYPDFVAELDDGTILVVEYKGEGYRTNDDSKEKQQLGRLWAARSGGRAKFLMACEGEGGLTVREQIDQEIRVGPGSVAV